MMILIFGYVGVLFVFNLNIMDLLDLYVVCFFDSNYICLIFLFVILGFFSFYLFFNIVNMRL